VQPLAECCVSSHPADYGTGDYEYTVVNKRTVVVEPGTRRVVQIID